MTDRLERMRAEFELFNRTPAGQLDVVLGLDEANAAGSGSVSVDGQMVDAASIKLARNTLGKVPKKDS